MPTRVDPATRQRIRDKFFKLLWDQVRPFAYLATDAVEVHTFDGRLLSRPQVRRREREILWDNYVEPFLEDLCSTETAVISDPRALREVRVDSIEGSIRIYWVTADMHRALWPRPFLVRRDTSDEVGRMVAFLDRCIAERGR